MQKRVIDGTAHEQSMCVCMYAYMYVCVVAFMETSDIGAEDAMPMYIHTYTHKYIQMRKRHPP